MNAVIRGEGHLAISSELAQFAAEWLECKNSFSASDDLCNLKAFHDQYICDENFRASLEKDFQSVLKTHYPRLRSSDVNSYVNRTTYRIANLSKHRSELNIRLHEILKTEQSYRQHLKSLQPLHIGMKEWRKAQITRLSKEDMSERCAQITHIPFAIELTEGCSGGCHFCGLSASPLQTGVVGYNNNVDLFNTLLHELYEICGLNAIGGTLYMATDPFDHPEFEQYAASFKKILGLWPVMTTALAERNLKRMKSLINLRADGQDRPWGIRCSLRSKSAYQTLFRELSPLERASLVLIPQYPGALSEQAIAGRAFSIKDQESQHLLGGTIACVSGFLISLPRQLISLVTPCVAEPNHPKGYRILCQTSFTAETLRPKLELLLSQMPCPAIDAQTLLRLTIDSSQFKLYQQPSCPNLLEIMAQQPFSINTLLASMPEHYYKQEVISTSLKMLQSGALRITSPRRL